ncbi:MAG TPA: hypothetical protein VLA71_08860, partial [Algoriphagus sp.]|nr:hypothetical protein [Algoriphagus sp.]
APDWSDHSHSIAFSVESLSQETAMHIMINAYSETLEFEIPPIIGFGNNWRLWVDTNRISPEDIFDWFKGPVVTESHFQVKAHSIVILES